ncbi:MAG: DEAD/DEAH box helicase [Bacteroidales bacterium]|nr:DEAD/DEAH box helicase [Bacteroidales bacterium]
MNNFTETGLADVLLKAVSELGFEKTTPIQAKTIPHLLNSGQDLIAFAQTGTGKTAAFGLPALHLTQVEDRRTQTLVLCPTRELCMQITKDLTNYSKYMKGVNIVAVYGGSSADVQIKALNKGAQVVVATPGRAKDLINRRKLKLATLDRVVLDEADEMLSMGFKEDLDAILSKMPGSRQTLLFSATMSKEVMGITGKYMNNPVELSATQMNTVAVNVNHQYYMVHARDRYEVIKRIADINPNIYGIVFCRTRRETKEVASKLMNDAYNADALHGDLSQAQRDEVMNRFRTRQLQLLVATDVAARGLDVNNLTHIINFNLPDDNEIYIHRSGRTGRAGKSGISIAIVHTREGKRIKEIEKKFGIKFSKELVPGGKEICTKQLYSLIDKIEKVQVDEKQIGPFMPAIYKKLEWLSREELIKHFVSAEFNRFLDYYKNAKDINVDESQERGKKGKREKRSRDERRQTAFTRIFINAGSKNDLTPARLIGVINEGLRSGEAEIGKIEILRKFSFFEIEDGMAVKLIDALKGKDFEGISLSLEVSQERPEFANYQKSKSPKHKGYKNMRDKWKKGKEKRSGGGGRGRRK